MPAISTLLLEAKQPDTPLSPGLCPRMDRAQQLSHTPLGTHGPHVGESQMVLFKLSL